jgi:hypothetical protein
MSTTSILRYVNGALESALSASILIRASTGIVSIASTPITPVSTGSYSFDVTALPAGNYTAEWTFGELVNSVTVFSTVIRPFVVDPPIALSAGTTLMEIEQALSGRLGGVYRRFQAMTGSTITSVYSSRIKTSVNIAEYDDLYILRRGVLQNGTRVANFSADDRVRMVSDYNHVTGTLYPDRDYALAPANTEMIELHYFDPEFELRPSVLDGLKRCYFWDTVSIASVAPYGKINVSTLAPWITSPRQIMSAEAQAGSANRFPSTRIPWSRSYQVGSAVYLDTSNTLPGTTVLTVLRPVGSLVNGDMSLSGPDDDWDVLPVELEYAVRAAHVAAWTRHPERLTPVAAQGMGIPLSMAAQAFTTRSLAMVNFVPEFEQIRFGSGIASGDIVVGNLAEPVV